MSWALPPELFADIVIPTTGVIIVAPILAALGVWWLITRMDRIAHGVFPHLAWEHSLGWFNIKAERRARAAFRWIRRGMYLLLFDALAIMLWTACDFPSLQGPLGPGDLANLISCASLFILCLGIWVLYLGCGLLPAIRSRRDMTALKKFRAQLEELEQERGEYVPKSRVHASLAKPALQQPAAPLGPNRRRFNHPGG